MTQEEKLEKLAEALEVEASELNPEMALADLEAWNSMSKLGVIVMFEDECGKLIGAKDLKQFATIADVLAAMD